MVVFQPRVLLLQCRFVVIVPEFLHVFQVLCNVPNLSQIDLRAFNSVLESRWRIGKRKEEPKVLGGHKFNN